MIQIGLLILGLAMAAGPGLPEVLVAPDSSAAKFRIDDATLVYDTEGADTEGIVDADVDTLLRLLRQNDGITLLQINSFGGELFASERMRDIVIDFGLDTRVHGECDSACVTVFLAGTRRTMSRGSRLGFHQTFWSAEDIADYYRSEREAQGWQTPFDFAEWMYLDTQEEVYRHLEYMVSRGVDPAFAIKAIRDPGTDIWHPYRDELLKAGVLTE